MGRHQPCGWIFDNHQNRNTPQMGIRCLLSSLLDVFKLEKVQINRSRLEAELQTYNSQLSSCTLKVIIFVGWPATGCPSIPGTKQANYQQKCFCLVPFSNPKLKWLEKWVRVRVCVCVKPIVCSVLTTERYRAFSSTDSFSGGIAVPMPHSSNVFQGYLMHLVTRWQGDSRVRHHTTIVSQWWTMQTEAKHKYQPLQSETHRYFNTLFFISLRMQLPS